MRLGVLLLLGLVAGGCTGAKEEQRSCTLMGCSSTVAFELGSPHLRYADELPLTLHGCVAENCASWTLDAEDCKPTSKEDDWFLYSCGVDYREQVKVVLPLPERGEREIPVKLSVHSKDGDELFEGHQTVAITPFYPNGYECDKDYPCYSGKADFSSAFR